MMASSGFGVTSAQRPDGWCPAASACGSVCSASDCMHSTCSLEMDAPCTHMDGERCSGVSVTSGISWGQSFAAQPGAAGLAEPDVACQATVFFANQNAAAAAVGCPCKACVKTVATITQTDVQLSQPWAYQRPEHRGNASQKYYPQAFGGRSQATFCDVLTAISPAGSAVREVRPDDDEGEGDDDDDQTLRMLLDRAKQDFDATAVAPANRKSEPGPSQIPMRRTAPGGILQPAYQRFQAPPMYRRRAEARSTSPIPVPSPPPRAGAHSGAGARRGRQAPAAVAKSVGEAALCDGARGREYDEGGVVRVEDLQHDKMLHAIMRLYGAIREDRARRPPGRPSEPMSIVIGFEPKPWPAGFVGRQAGRLRYSVIRIIRELEV